MSATILIVEDDAELRRLFRVALVLSGFTVLEAPDGWDAIRILDRNPPDLVVLDLVLPTLSGIAVQQEIAAHAHTRNIPIVVVTGTDMRVSNVPCLLRKPITPDELVEAVRKCLSSAALNPHA